MSSALDLLSILIMSFSVFTGWQNLLATTHQTTDERQILGSTTGLLLLVVAAHDAAESETAQQLVNAKTSHDAVDQPSEAETAQKSADEVENTDQQKPDSL